jgi:hypothetical protein
LAFNSRLICSNIAGSASVAEGFAKRSKPDKGEL